MWCSQNTNTVLEAITALPPHTINNQISNGFNQSRLSKRTYIVCCYRLSSGIWYWGSGYTTYDTCNTTVPTSVKKWLRSYLSARSSFLEYRKKKSHTRKIEQGVQGKVVSSRLYSEAFLSRATTNSLPKWCKLLLLTSKPDITNRSSTSKTVLTISCSRLFDSRKDVNL